MKRLGIRDIWGVYCLPVLPNYYVSHQWLRELKRRGHRVTVGVYFSLPDEQTVWLGHFGGPHEAMTAAKAAGKVMHAPGRAWSRINRPSCDQTARQSLDTSATPYHRLALQAWCTRRGALLVPALSPMRIALTLVHLGLDLGSIITRTTMAKGLAFALARLGLEVVPRHAAPPRAADRHPDGVLVVEDDQLTG